MQKFSSEWWKLMEKKALFIFNNYAWKSHYYSIAQYCNDRAYQAFWREVKQRNSNYIMKTPK